MITLIVIICAIIGFLLIKRGRKLDTSDNYSDDGFTSYVFATISLILAFVLILFLFGSTNNIVRSRITNQKIEMYQEENKNIEDKMDVLVKQYMDYEKNTLSDFKSDSSITLVSMYPELKSDALVQNQLNTYVDNNNKIKELKNSLLDVSMSKWWLYFGR